ncbi:MAG TPA: BolA family protein [Nannocystis sp.]
MSEAVPSGRRAQRLAQAIAEAIEVEHLEVHDESHMHAVPRGAESHFRVVVVSSAFAGKSLVQRHREVNAAVAAEFAAGLHALAIEALTPEQWAARGEQAAKSPPCLGGSKHG